MTQYHSISGNEIDQFKKPGKVTVLAAAFVQLTAASAAAQTGTVEGRVTAQEGNPIAGAQVSVVGTSLGTRTSDDGRYTLMNLSPGSHQQSRPQSRRDSTIRASAGLDVRTQPPSPMVMWWAG